MKRILIPVTILLLVGLGIAWFIWNKPHPKAEDQDSISLTAEALYAAFQQDEGAANTRYLNKVLSVTGEIISQELNQDGQTVAILRGAPGDDLLAGGVMCTLRDKGTNLPKEGTVTIKGFCTGFGNDVHLTDCVTQQ